MIIVWVFAATLDYPSFNTVMAIETPVKREYQGRQMGVDIQITLYGDQEEVANQAAAAAFDRIAELNQIFSDYDAQSEAMRLCARPDFGSPQSASPELLRILKYAAELSRKSNGAFDVTIGPLTKMWRRARRRVELPDDEFLEATRQRVGWKFVHLDLPAGRVSLSRGDMQFDFGGIVKGYAGDEALAVLRRHGIRSALVAIAGDIVAGDPPPDAEGWQVGVARLDAESGAPSQWLSLANAAVSTSGDAFQFVEIDGVRYSHIIDPRTGRALTRHGSVTVVARSGIEADSLATTASILGTDEGMRLLKEAEVAGLFVTAEDGVIHTAHTPNWPGYQSLEGR